MTGPTLCYLFVTAGYIGTNMNTPNNNKNTRTQLQTKVVGDNHNIVEFNTGYSPPVIQLLNNNISNNDNNVKLQRPNLHTVRQTILQMRTTSQDHHII